MKTLKDVLQAHSQAALKEILEHAISVKNDAVSRGEIELSKECHEIISLVVGLMSRHQNLQNIYKKIG